MAIRQDLFIALAEAHQAGDTQRARGLILQGAAHVKGDARERLQSIANKHTELPQDARNLVYELADVDLASLTLGAALRATLKDIVVEHQHRMRLFEHGLRPRSRLLFVGPPGNGKTSAAAGLAKAIGVQAYGVALWGVQGSYLGETGRHLSKVIPLLDHQITLVLDEFDSVGATRSDGSDPSNKERNSAVNTLCTLLDHAGGGLLVATTNRRNAIDPALLRRFDAEVLFPGPTTEQAQSLVGRLGLRYGVDGIKMLFGDEPPPSFDAITKSVEARAREHVLGLIRAETPAGIEP